MNGGYNLYDQILHKYGFLYKFMLIVALFMNDNKIFSLWCV